MGERRTLFKRKLVWAVIFALCLAGLAWWQPPLVARPVQGIFQTVAWPFQKVLAPVAFGTRSLFQFFGNIAELKGNNENLERERRALLAENARLKELVKEDEELRRSFDLLPRDRFDVVAARVIGRDQGILSTTVEIDRGSLQGIERDMPVIVEAGVLVGRVTDVFPQSARVMLLTHPESVVNATTNDTGARGIVRGEHGLGAVFDMVQQNETLRAGDTVVTSGLGARTPKGLLVGRIENVRLGEDQLFQRAVITSPVDLQSLQFLFVIKEARS